MIEHKQPAVLKAIYSENYIWNLLIDKGGGGRITTGMTASDCTGFIWNKGIFLFSSFYGAVICICTQNWLLTSYC